MNKLLPVLLSIPHGGILIPEEVKERVCLSRHDLFDDTDAFTREIYDLGSKAAAVVTTGIARAFVDLNRAPHDLPPGNPDGVVKSHTCFAKPVYRKGFELDSKLTRTLLRRYYHPYHRKIRQTVLLSDIKLALDCHSMAEVGPPIAPDAGEKRPAVCLGNVNGTSCDESVIEKLAESFRKSFDLSWNQVKINQPFSGGYITRTYGRKPISWVQVEISREMYLSPPWFDRHSLKIDPERLNHLSLMFEKALILFFDLIR